MLLVLATPVAAEQPLTTDGDLPPAAAPEGDADFVDAKPTAAYPAAFLRPVRQPTATLRGDVSRNSDATESGAAAAAFADEVPARDSNSLAARLKAIEDMATLWDNDGARIFVGLDDDGHPGIHIKNK